MIVAGQKFSRLAVLCRDSARKYHWVCECSCGSKTSVRSDSLQSGKSQSCGCLRDEAASRTGMTMLRHGQAKQRTGETTPEYTAWLSMKARCTNPKNKKWDRYGGRGIKVDPLWIEDFEAFFAHMGRRPSPEHSLDRFPNNDGNYEPGNVRWATSKEQQNNRGNNKTKAA
jgi:hypothetical protein